MAEQNTPRYLQARKVTQLLIQYPRIKRANHARAGPNAVLIQGRGFVTSGEIQFLVGKVNALGPARGPGGFKNQFGLAAQKFLGRQRSQVLRGRKDLAQILGAAHALRVNAVLAQFAREELLVLRGVTHNLDKRIRTYPSRITEGGMCLPQRTSAGTESPTKARSKNFRA